MDHQLRAIAKNLPSEVQNGPSESITAARHLRRAICMEEETRPSVILPPDGLAADSIRPITHRPARIAQRAVKHDQLVLLDPVTYVERASADSVLRNVCKLATRLRNADPFTFRLLECKGVLQEPAPPSITKTGLLFVFCLPSSHD